jgi:hypothetical protein
MDEGGFTKSEARGDASHATTDHRVAINSGAAARRVGGSVRQVGRGHWPEYRDWCRTSGRRGKSAIDEPRDKFKSNNKLKSNQIEILR